MARKKTVEELLEEAKRAEKRAKDLRALAKKETAAEEAKVNAEIIKAVREWRDSYPEGKRTAWKDMPKVFRDWAERNRQKRAEQGQR